MSAATDCNCACPTPTITHIPGETGAAGAAGTNGTNGVSVFTTLSSDATFADEVATVNVSVVSNVMFVVGQTVFAADPSAGTDHGTFEVISKTGLTVIGLRYTGAPGDTVAPFTIGSGGQVTSVGATGALSAALPTAVDYSLLTTAGAVNNLAIATGAGAYNLTFPCHPETGVSAGQVVTEYKIGHKFRIIAWAFVPTVAMVGGSRVFNMEIDTDDVGTTPSTVTIPATAIGVVIAGTTVAGENTGSATQKFSIEVAAGGISLSSGEGYFIVLIQNMDTADAVASLSDHVNDLITSLT